MGPHTSQSLATTFCAKKYAKDSKMRFRICKIAQLAERICVRVVGLMMRDGEVVSRLVHTQEIAGSTPAPATMPLESVGEREQKGRHMPETNLKQSSPWVVFANQVEALFRDDPEVITAFDNDELELTIMVQNQTKADAIATLIGTERQFGNVMLKISVVPANDEMSNADLFRQAFQGNPAFRDVVTPTGPYPFLMDYVVFDPESVQYRNDSLQSAFGICTTVYEDIARDVFGEVDGVFFCSDVKSGLSFGTPLGEWP